MGLRSTSKPAADQGVVATDAAEADDPINVIDGDVGKFLAVFFDGTQDRFTDVDVYPTLLPGSMLQRFWIEVAIGEQRRVRVCAPMSSTTTSPESTSEGTSSPLSSRTKQAAAPMPSGQTVTVLYAQARGSCRP